MKPKGFSTILVVLGIILVLGVIITAFWRLSNLMWIIRGDNKSVFPTREECIRDFRVGTTTLVELKKILGEPTSINKVPGTGDFLELYYRTMKEKDAGCTYLFDKTGILRDMRLRGNPVA